MVLVDVFTDHVLHIALLVFAMPLVAGLLPMFVAQALMLRVTEGPRKLRKARALERRCALDAFEAGLANMNTRLNNLEMELAPRKGGLQ